MPKGVDIHEMKKEQNHAFLFWERGSLSFRMWVKYQQKEEYHTRRKRAKGREREKKWRQGTTWFASAAKSWRPWRKEEGMICGFILLCVCVCGGVDDEIPSVVMERKRACVVV